MGMVTKTVRLVPTAYSIAYGDASAFSNLDNALTNVDSDTYASVIDSSSSPKSVDFTFDYNAIPEDATVNSFEFKVKVQNNQIASMQAVTRRSNSADTTVYFSMGLSTQTLTPTGSFSYYKSNGYFVRIGTTGSASCSFYIYGVEMDVTYEAFEPDTHGIFNLILPRG